MIETEMLGRCSLRFTRALYIYIIFHQAWPRRGNSGFWPRERGKEILDRRSIDSSFHPGWEKNKSWSCLWNDVAIFMYLMYIFFISFFFSFLRRIVSFFFFAHFSYFFFFFLFFSIFSFRARSLLTFVGTRLCTSFIGWVSRITYQHFRRSHTTRTRANHDVHGYTHIHTHTRTHM